MSTQIDKKVFYFNNNPERMLSYDYIAIPFNLSEPAHPQQSYRNKNFKEQKNVQHMKCFKCNVLASSKTQVLYIKENLQSILPQKVQQYQ